MSRSPAESDGRCARPGLDHRTGSAPAVGASRGAPGDELSVKAAPARSPAGRPVRANIPRSGGTRLAPGPAPAAGQRHRRPRFCSSPERPCARPGASSAQPPPLSRCPRPPAQCPAVAAGWPLRSPVPAPARPPRRLRGPQTAPSVSSPSPPGSSCRRRARAPADLRPCGRGEGRGARLTPRKRCQGGS